MTSFRPPNPGSTTSIGGNAPSSRRLRAAFQRFPRSLFTQPLSQSPDEQRLHVVPNHLVSSLLEALALTGRERVLEIGSDDAYLTALLSHLGGEVYSVAADSEQADARARELGALGCVNVQIVHADAGTGWPNAAPYQAIVVGAGVPSVPRELVDQLDAGGRLVIPIGNESAQLLECLRKRQGALDSATLGACRLKMLAGMPRTPSNYPWTPPS
jgi:protein-L-isoaspartate(D-aspartate) O-methyltransferase